MISRPDQSRPSREQQLKPSRQILPWSKAQFSRATRFLAPVLVKILLTWLSTVRLLIVSEWAISWLVSPWATSSTISISRSESSFTGRDGAVASV